MKQLVFYILSVCLCSCLSYPGCKLRLFYAVFYCRLYHVFPHYLRNGTIFGKKIIEHKICVSIFAGTLSETFLGLRIIRRDIIINGRMS